MAIPYHPAQGAVLICDFDGLRTPEMIKRRPVVVISPKFKGRERLCTVVPLSTRDPDTVEAYHYYLRFDPILPWPYDSEYMWVKGDMAYTLSLDRMNMPFEKDEHGTRRFVQYQLSDENFNIVLGCLLEGQGLGHLKSGL